MSRNSQQTWDAISKCNLIPPAIRTRVERSKNFADLVGGESPKPLLSTLVKANILTEYQAKALYVGKEAELTRGGWIVRQPMKSESWQSWFVGTPTVESEAVANKGTADSILERWIRLLSHEETKSKPATNVSRERLRILKQADSPYLVPFHVSNWGDRGFCIAFSPASGSLLSEFDLSKQAGTTDSQRSNVWFQLIESAYSGLSAIQSLGVNLATIHPDFLFVPATSTTGGATINWFIDPVFESTEEAAEQLDQSSVLWQINSTNVPTSAVQFSNQHTRELWQLTAALQQQLTARGTDLAPLSSRLLKLQSKLESGQLTDAAEVVRYWSDTKKVDNLSDDRLHNQSSPVLPKTLETAPVIRRRKKRKSPLILAASIVLPTVLVVAGTLVWISMSGQREAKPPTTQPATSTKAEANPSPAQPTDQRLSLYRVSTDASRPWLPPLANKPIDLRGFPSGGQMFVVLHPHRIASANSGASNGSSDIDVRQETEEVKHLFQTQWEQFSEWFERTSRISIDAAEQITVAVYPKTGVNESERYVLQVRLKEPMLEKDWVEKIGGNGAVTDEKLMLRSGTNEAFWIVERNPPEAVRTFTVGMATDMQEVAESEGEPFYLPPQMEQLNAKSNEEYDFVLLLTPRFLTGDQRGLLSTLPNRAAEWIRELLSDDARAMLIQLQLDDPWYAEVRWVGASDIDAGRRSEWMTKQFASAGDTMEQWIVSTVPDPAWRGLAIRMPAILRSLADYSRTGVEDGNMVSNFYLPLESASDVIGGLWLSGQDWAVSSTSESIGGEQGTEQKTLTIGEFLESKIRVSFDQESIEVALQLAGSQANTLLNGSEALPEFILDGGAFERDGITRNQQLKNFSLNDRSVRDVMTEIAKRGNPVTTVTDLRQSDQKLLWVVLQKADDGVWQSVDQNNSLSANPIRVSLTTRAEAEKNSWILPDEFRSPSP